MKHLGPLLLLALTACGKQDAAADTPAKPKILFETLASYDYKPGVAVPEDVKKLHGREVSITGFMYPTSQVRDIREFILMKDRGTCCYGAKTQWTHFLQVTIPPGRPALHYTTDPVTVAGSFKLDEQVEDGYVMGLYFLEAKEHRK